jgi:hypothetical protein
MNKKHAAGKRQEETVKYFLDREFRKDKSVHVFHDVKIDLGDIRAQIDHLVLHHRGFILIESKSIYGGVRVNSQGEWERSYNNNWIGMPSPIKQIDLQCDAIAEILEDNAVKLLDKFLGVQKHFGGMEFDKYVAVSSSAMLDRENMPSDISKSVYKAEFIAQKVKDIVTGDSNRLKMLITNRPVFSSDDIDRLSQFLLSLNGAGSSEASHSKPIIEVQDNPLDSNPTEKAQKTVSISCKKCSASTGLTPAYGKFGYYVSCGNCKTNTSMKQPCPACNDSGSRIKKEGKKYSVVCEKCASKTLISIR